VTGSSVNLSWAPRERRHHCTITGYRAFQNGTQVATPAAACAGTWAQPRTSYSFTVAAVNPFGASGPERGVAGTTGPAAGRRAARVLGSEHIQCAERDDVQVPEPYQRRYPDSQMYWAFTQNGVTQVHSFAQVPTFDMPANSAGRMYFYIVTDPSDPVISADPTGARTSISSSSPSAAADGL